MRTLALALCLLLTTFVHAADVDALRKMAEEGDDLAQTDLGVLYAKGEGVRRDYSEAVKWWRKAAEQGYAQAQFYLGMAYRNGQGVLKNDVEASKWVHKAAVQGVASAQVYLGAAYGDGTGVPKNIEESLKWFRMGAEQGHIGAQFWLGQLFEHGRGDSVPMNIVEAAKWYRMAADQGHPVAQNQLAFMYLAGKGVPKDGAEAVKWMRKAADQGAGLSQYNLGSWYLEGEVVARDVTEALKWIRMAAEQGVADAEKVVDWIANVDSLRTEAESGDHDAQFRLGVELSSGRPGLQNFAEAVEWYRKAADSGITAAQHELGKAYRDGRGVPKDLAESVKWFRMVADQGDASAQLYVARMLGSGIGDSLPRDRDEAFTWYRRAAAQGDKNAQIELGAQYAQGWGVPKNDLLAYKWFLLGREQGGTIFTKRNITLIEARLTPEQIAEGKRLAAEFKPKREQLDYVLDLDGANSFVELPHGIFAGLNESTIECWIKWDSFQNSSRAFDFVIGNKLVDVMNRGNTPNLWAETFVNGNRMHHQATGVLRLNRWTHIALTTGRTGISLYIDGNLHQQRPMIAQDTFRSSEFGRRNLLGRSNAKNVWPNDQDLDGQLDEVRVWSRIRTPEEIKAGMNSKLTGNERGLVGLWNFDDPANPGRDLSPGNHHGKLGGNASVTIGSHR